MRVLIISHMYPSAANSVSGVFVQKQAEAMNKAGAESVIIHPVPWAPFFLRWHPRWRLYGQTAREEQHGEMMVYRPRYLELPRGWLLGSAARRMYSGMASLMRRVMRTWRPDIIQAHVAHPDGAAAVRFGKKYGVPVVVTVHGLDLYHTLVYNRACERSVKKALITADRVIFVSEALIKNYGIQKWIGDPAKLMVIYNGVNLADVSGDDGANLVGNRSGKGEEDPVLLTVGFMEERKGHAYVLKALPDLLKSYPRLTYRIVGDGEERGALERLAEELGVRDHVVFLGALSHGETMREMAGCDVMVLPSWNEGFGVVYLEAMAQGKPVVGTQGEGAASLIEKEGVGLTVPPRDEKAIVHAVQQIFDNHEQARAMGKRGKELVFSEFTWAHNAARTLSLYREVLQEEQSI